MFGWIIDIVIGMIPSWFWPALALAGGGVVERASAHARVASPARHLGRTGAE